MLIFCALAGLILSSGLSKALGGALIDRMKILEFQEFSTSHLRIGLKIAQKKLV